MEQNNYFVNIITLNCWGIPYVSKNRNERMTAIAAYLSKGLHDIVCLQEVWDEGDFNLIKNKVINVLPYSHYFYSGVLGSGICVLSKWTIEEVFFHAWPLNGYVHMIHHGDWFGGKGVGLCRVKYNGLNINVYSAHLHAEYSTDDIYLAHRVLQAFNTAEFIKMTSSSADLIVLAGDLNTQPQDLAYRILCETGLLIDSCTSAITSKDVTDKLICKSGTNERAGNSYTDLIEGAKCPEGKRIDYILYHPGKEYTADVVDYSLPISDKVAGCCFSYSDHDAVSTLLNVKKSVASGNHIRTREEYAITLENALSVCQGALSTLKYSGRKYLIYASSIFLLLLSTVGMAESTYVDIPRLLTVAVLFYCLFMGTLWNAMEWNGVLAGQKSLEILYKNLSIKKNHPDKEQDHQSP